MKKSRIGVLRLGYRLVRDDRITTHLGLVARAFGADIIYLYDCDKSVKESIDKVTKRWGGSFESLIVDRWRDVIREWKDKGSLIIHLTMYGLPLQDVIDTIKNFEKDLLIIVGAEKVQKEVYMLSDYNVAIGNQPHSEVAALALFLDRYFEGKELNREFEGAKLKIIPQLKGKKVIRL
ncbi:MAG: tRNA (cytidine(56)-2'-O)-methyltransferase [Nitrososphaerales archaeon]